MGDLGDTLRARGLSRVADALVAHAREAITISTRRANEDALTVGASKLGGLPDLPPALPWPEVDGHPLPFVAQLKMADVAPYDHPGVLPPTGLLSFFWNGDREPDDGVTDWAVLYLDGDGEPLTRRPAPPHLSERQRYHACAPSFSSAQTFPPNYAAVVQDLALTERERRAYIDVLLGSDGHGMYERVTRPAHGRYPHCSTGRWRSCRWRSGRSRMPSLSTPLSRACTR